MIERGDRIHIAVERNDIGETRKHGADGAIAFGALTMDDVRVQRAQFPSGRPDAALVKRAHPSDLWDKQFVIPDVVGEFFGRLHRLLDAGDNVDFMFGHCRQSLQQRFGRGAEGDIGIGIIPVVLALVGGKNGDTHSGNGQFD